MGERLGQYRLGERIGAGGMGVVYRAFDTRLQRPVAIKLVSDPSVSGETARARILNEARMASALNHPSICTIHEVGEHDETVFLVMEYVEGRRIDTLVPADGLAAETVIRHGVAIASALEHAHERGVLHRDLKSANVVVTPDGTAKVLDFGIARRASSGPEESTRTGTSPGVTGIAGTPAYLAPEVLAGQPSSTRSDIWSLGILLHELATGTVPFTGRSTFEITAAILREPVPPMPASILPGLRAVILRCLSKEPEHRYARAGEARAALEAIGQDLRTASAGRRSSRAFGWTAAAILVVATVGVLAALWARPGWRSALSGLSSPSSSSRLTLLLSSEQRIVDPMLSPDGRVLTYVSQDEFGQYDLYVSQIPDGGQIRLTDNAAIEAWPRFSPDGQRIIFTSREAGVSVLHIINTFGGAATPAVAFAREGSWSPDGSRLAFVYRPEEAEAAALATSRPDGSDLEVLFTAEPAHPFIRDPAWSADSRQLAFVLSFGGASGEVWLIPADGGTARRLLNESVGVFHAEPVFTSDGRDVVLSSNRGGATNLWSVPLGGGEPAQLTTGPGPDMSPSTAVDGAVAFLNSRWRSALAVADVERGRSRTILSHSPYLWAPAVSPDGTLIAFGRAETNGLWHIWVVPVAGGSARQLTSGDNGELYPRFTPDGRTVLYHSWGEPHRLWKVPLAGGAPTRVTTDDMSEEAWADVSPDGRSIAFVRIVNGIEHVYVAPLEGGPARLLTGTPGTTPRWSPDGAHIAFGHDRSYDGGVFVTDADGQNERRLTATGGWPVWWPDGRSLAFLVVDDQGNQNVRMVDLAGRPIAGWVWPSFIGTNHLVDVFGDGRSIVSTSAIHQSDEVWLLRR